MRYLLKQGTLFWSTDDESRVSARFRNQSNRTISDFCRGENCAFLHMWVAAAFGRGMSQKRRLAKEYKDLQGSRYSDVKGSVPVLLWNLH